MSADRYAERRARALEAAAEAGLAGLLVAPGADLVYLTGHEPPPLERLTLLILAAGRAPVLVVPELERPAAEGAPGDRGRRAPVLAGRGGSLRGGGPDPRGRRPPAP